MRLDQSPLGAVRSDGRNSGETGGAIRVLQESPSVSGPRSVTPAIHGPCSTLARIAFGRHPLRLVDHDTGYDLRHEQGFFAHGRVRHGGALWAHRASGEPRDGEGAIDSVGVTLSAVEITWEPAARQVVGEIQRAASNGSRQTRAGQLLPRGRPDRVPAFGFESRFP